MKKIMLCCIAILSLYGAGLAQKSTAAYWNNTPEVKWANQGFWVVESQVKTPRKNIIYYYNDQQVLIQLETIDGRKLHISKQKVRKELNRKLAIAMENWAVLHTDHGDSTKAVAVK